MNRKKRRLIKFCEEVRSGKRKYKFKPHKKKTVMTNSYGIILNSFKSQNKQKRNKKR